MFKGFVTGLYIFSRGDTKYHVNHAVPLALKLSFIVNSSHRSCGRVWGVYTEQGLLAWASQLTRTEVRLAKPGRVVPEADHSRLLAGSD